MSPICRHLTPRTPCSVPRAGTFCLKEAGQCGCQRRAFTPAIHIVGGGSVRRFMWPCPKRTQWAHRPLDGCHSAPRRPNSALILSLTLRLSHAQGGWCFSLQQCGTAQCHSTATKGSASRSMCGGEGVRVLSTGKFSQASEPNHPASRLRMCLLFHRLTQQSQHNQ